MDLERIGQITEKYRKTPHHLAASALTSSVRERWQVLPKFRQFFAEQ